MSSRLLEVVDLESGYGGIPVLRGLSLHLNSDECIGLFGPNGHGKTTLFRTISGLLKPWRGQIVFGGEVINGLSPRQVVDQGIIHVPQGSSLFPRMTVMENLMMGAYSGRVWSKRKELVERVFEIFPKLAARRSQMVRTLSGGERQMVAIGIGLMGDARLLMVDEITLGLAPKIKDEVYDAVGLIIKSGIPLVIADQDVKFLMGLTKRLYLIEEGRTALEISTDKALDDVDIATMYFGGSKAFNSSTPTKR